VKRTSTRPKAPNRLAPHRKIERGSAMPIYLRLGMIAGIVVLGGVVLFAGIGVLGRAVAIVSTSFSEAISQVTNSPSPSPSEAIAPNAPALTLPGESYTNQATVDLSGTVPATFAGQEDVTIRIYRQLQDQGSEQLTEIPVGATPAFIVPGIELAKGRNDFTATIVGPGGESDPSQAITFILDTSKPKITVTKPAKDGVVNGKTVTIIGKTQARSSLVAKNLANNASVTGKAGDDGAFKLVLAVANGPNAIRITATDPAQNQAAVVLNVNRGGGKLRADLTLSRYQFYRKQLPTDVTLTIEVTDPDGHPLDGATVTFTLTPPGVGPITRTMTTDGAGRVRWRTAIPKGASAGRGNASALVHTKDYGNTTTQTFITINR
jgi:hypothetical protein